MKKDISILLMAVVILAFFLRIGSFQREHTLTFDESVYAMLGSELAQGNFQNYSTQRIYKAETSRGRKLPEYLNAPLFKHPPVFASLIAVSYKIFGQSLYSAFKVSLLFGILLIAVAYYLAQELFQDNRTAVYAAVIMSVEPVAWICSQKIWMETTLAFFMGLSLYLFARCLNRYNRYVMTGSGLAAGLAVLTKYPGILVTFAVFLYAVCCGRWLFRKRSFLLSLLLPLVMLVPWILWNHNVYGGAFFRQITARLAQLGATAGGFLLFLTEYWYVAALVLAAAVLYVLWKKNIILKEVPEKAAGRVRKVLYAVPVLLVLILLRENIFHALDMSHIPSAGWEMGMFSKAPVWFYAGRLVELSPFYIFAYVSLMGPAFDKGRKRSYFLLWIFSLTVLVFWMAWGNYQSRYILAASMPLFVLAAGITASIFKKIMRVRGRRIRHLAAGALGVTVLYFFIKTIMIDLALAVPNRICYF